MDSSGPVNQDPRRAIPSVDRLTGELLERDPALPRWAATEAARRTVAEARERLGGQSGASGSPDWVDLARRTAESLRQRRPRRVINGTGIVLHTNLGRAPMAAGAAEAAAEVAAGYSDLELDLGEGRRGNRLGALEDKLRLLTGAEAAYACNNNAAAVLLALNTMAVGREVIVSRGELVEIGGSFRVPEIMRRAGVKLVEVGSTNRTHPADYESAIGPDTAMLLKVHRSNFEMSGFVREVDLPGLVSIGRAHSVPVVEDLGSGSLIDLSEHGFPAESFAPARLAMGPDLICFSGDKLMGGPQAGLLLGSNEVIGAIRKNPLARALRLDKMTLAALDWTLGAVLDGRAETELPVMRQLLARPADLEARAHRFVTALTKSCASASELTIGVESDRVPVGGGSLPGFELDGYVVVVRGGPGGRRLAAGLRDADPPILARVRDDALLIDLRTVGEDEVDTLVETLASLIG
jgi:L-seryl-tRNA(Ser) seleniumtransferase